MDQPAEQHECGVDAVSISLAPVVGAEADHLLVLSDEYMASLYPAESNHLVSSESLRAGDAVFLGAFMPSMPSMMSSSPETVEHSVETGVPSSRGESGLDWRWASISPRPTLCTDRSVIATFPPSAIIWWIHSVSFSKKLRSGRRDTAKFPPVMAVIYWLERLCFPLTPDYTRASGEVFLRLLSTTAVGNVSRAERRHTEAEQKNQSSQ